MQIASINETTQNKINEYKMLARSYYVDYFNLFNILGYNCGHELFKQISRDGNELALKFNRTMEHLEQLDPSCPKGNRL